MYEDRLHDAISPSEYRRMTAKLVSAYVKRNNVLAPDLARLITSAAYALNGLANSGTPAASEAGKATPAQIRSSITNEVLISFEDGKGYKTLKRHLTAYGLTPETYRAKWGLPSNYPMVAPSYSEKRSAIATSLQLSRGYGAIHRKGWASKV